MHLDTEAPTWILRLDNPPVNAFSPAQFDAAFAFLERAEADPACKALVIAGANGVFSAGVDIRVLPTLDADGLRQLVRNINVLSLLIYGFPKPVVCAVEGHAIGLGAVIMAASDFRIAAEGGYRIGLNELDAGLQFPICAAELVLCSMSPTAARRLCLGAKLYPPHDPLLTELVDELVEPGVVLARAVEIANDRSAQPIYSDIKAQLRGATVERMHDLIEQDADPLIHNAEAAIARISGQR